MRYEGIINYKEIEGNMTYIQYTADTETVSFCLIFCFRELAFEKAYCEYRLNKVANAYETIQGASHATPRVLELQAQILYRLER